jgi:hypothetical protein
VYDTLLVLHLFAAFMLMATVVMHSAIVLGAQTGSRTAAVGNLLWDVGGLGTLVFGVWLAIYLDAYEITDGWILGAIVLWFAIAGVGARVRQDLQSASVDETPPVTAMIVRLHWLRTLIVVGFLVLMIWKPGV